MKQNIQNNELIQVELNRIDLSVLNELHLNPIKLNDVVEKLYEPHRFYHSFEHHISGLFDLIDVSQSSWRVKSILKIIALYHDSIYIPFFKDNEALSAQYFLESLNSTSKLASEIAIVIQDTDVKKVNLRNQYSLLFSALDLARLEDGPEHVWREDAKLIFKEYQCFAWPFFKEENIKFMKNLKETHPYLKDGCNSHISWLNNYRPRIGLYAGSFNPFHIGHMDVLEQAEKLFDKVIIAAGRNVQKTNIPKFQPRNFLPFHESFTYYSLLSDLIKEHSKYADVVLVRGLRSGYDLNYEERLLRYLQDDIPDVQVVYLFCKSTLSHVSSSSVREIAMFDSDKSKRYFPSKYDYYKKNYAKYSGK